MMRVEFGTRWGTAIALALSLVGGLPIAAIASQDIDNPVREPSSEPSPQAAPDLPAYSTFQQWCSAQATLPEATQHTIEILLTELGTEDCRLAGRRASVLTLLNLSHRQISDLRPLSSLPRLTELLLHNNAIADLSPLGQLSQLNRLYLNQNDITDLAPWPI